MRRRGAAAKRIAERLEPITLVVDTVHGPLQLVGYLQSPHARLGDLRDVEFAIREADVERMR